MKYYLDPDCGDSLSSMFVGYLIHMGVINASIKHDCSLLKKKKKKNSGDSLSSVFLGYIIHMGVINKHSSFLKKKRTATKSHQ